MSHSTPMMIVDSYQTSMRSLMKPALGSFHLPDSSILVTLETVLVYPRLLLVVLLGVFSHVQFFMKNEHHMSAPRILCNICLAFGMIASLLFTENEELWIAIQATAFLFAAYFSSLLLSMVVYRLYFHRLRSFPGPIFARITKLWHVAQNLSKPNFLLLDELHRKYGTIVRTGPNELSICTSEAMIAVHGPGSKCDKAPFYDLLLPRHSIVTTRERSLHDKRRRIWDQAFSIKAISGYEEVVLKYCEQLRDAVAASTQQTIDASALFHHFSFDVMGELSFGKSFDMLTSDKNHHIIDLLANGMRLLGVASPTPWLARIGFSLPLLANGWKTMFRWSDEQMQERLKEKSRKRDITSWLIDAMEQDGGTNDARAWLDGDGFSIIIAGSDTTFSALLFIFYYLARSPTHAGKIRAEVDGLSILNNVSLLPLPHLSAVINEVLRLHPSVPSAGLRVAPPQGLIISGQYIPGGTVLTVPTYSLHRDPNSFEDPLQFIPERWYSTSQMMSKPEAFAPFLRGRYSCVGRNLAMMELRLVTAILVSHFDIAFPPGSDNGEKFLRSTQDHFTAVPGKLELTFKRRS